MSAIEVANLKKYFGKTHAVDDISFEVQKGEIFGFLGPNGTGKTTTIRCLLDFLRADVGQIKIFDLDSRKNSTEIKKRIGYLSGDVRLYDGWTAKDHVLFLENLRGRQSIARDLVKKLNLAPNIKFKSLSSGNKQKLGLVLALMFEPELLIMDEPTLGLDPLLQNTIYEILQNLRGQGTTIFMSSHNLAEVDRICDRVGIIKDGKLVATESIQSLKEKRMYLVEIHFAGQFNKLDFNLENVEIRQELADGLILGVKGDLNFLIRILSRYQLKELEISRASLEEIFLEFYGLGNHQNQVKPIISRQDLQNIPQLEEK